MLLSQPTTPPVPMSESDNWRVKKKLPSPSTSSNSVSDNKFTYQTSPNRPREHGSGSAIQTQQRKTWNASGQRTNITHDASKAIEEGRRVYVVNMPDIAKRTDVEKLFEAYPVYEKNLYLFLESAEALLITEQ